MAMWTSFFGWVCCSEEFHILLFCVGLTQWMWRIWVTRQVVKRFCWKVRWVLEQVSLDKSDTTMHLLGTHHWDLYFSALSKAHPHFPGSLAFCTCVVTWVHPVVSYTKNPCDDCSGSFSICLHLDGIEKLFIIWVKPQHWPVSWSS